MDFSILPRRAYQVIVLGLVVAITLSCIHRAEYFDDAWFAEQAYWLIHNGHVRSELFRGLNGWENQIYVFHKLFIFTESLIFLILGVSVGASKVIGVLFGVVGLVLVWRYPDKGAIEQRWLAALLYLGCGTLIRYLCLNRPETMCMALGFASFFALQRAKTPRLALLAGGALAGLSALTHLNGLAYMVAGATFVLIRGGWRQAARFSIVSSLVLSLYAVDAAINNALPVLIAQFHQDPATQDGLNPTGKLMVMAKYHEQFFHSENEAALSVLVLLSLLVFRRHIRPTQPVFLYTVLLVVSFWLLSKSNTDIYFLLFLPWFSLLVAEVWVRFLPQQPRWQQQVSRLLLVGYLLIAGIQVVNVITENRHTPDSIVQNARLATYMPKQHSNVIAPLEFFFGQMDNYRVRGLTYYLLLSQKGPALSLPQFFALAQREGVMYVVGDHGRNATYNIPADAPATIGGYRRVYQDEWSSVYANQLPPK